MQEAKQIPRQKKIQQSSACNFIITNGSDTRREVCRLLAFKVVKIQNFSVEHL